MNIYVLINSRKIRNKVKSNLSYLKIALKDIKNEKKISSIIVNDIKIDFTISVISKSMNTNKSVSAKNVFKPKIPNISTVDNKKMKSPEKAKQKTNISTIENQKLKSPDKPKQKANIVFMKKAIRSGTLTNPVRSVSSAVKPKLSNPFFKPKKPEEKSDNTKRDSNAEQKYAAVRKNTVLEKVKKETEEKREYNKRPQFNSLAPRTIKPMKSKAIEEAAPRSRLKTINTEKLFLNPINYDKYLSENNPKNKNAKHRETFCEGFFIASFPQKDGQVVEKSQAFPASCGHPDCSSLPAMTPEIILRYPLEDTKTLELNNLAATICFPTGIKVCYSDKEPDMIKDYVTPITNQKGERYYMMTFHFYLKMENDIYSKNYEMHPLKHHLMKFADNYLNMSEDEMDKTVTEQIQKNLEQAQELGFRDNVYVPYCICLISKYPYVIQMKKCLQTIYSIIINNNESLNDPIEKNKINNLIMHLINSVPIPEDIKARVHFYIPYFSEGIELKCPKFNDLNIMNTTLSDLLKLFSIDYIVIFFRLLLFEKKILFIDDEYTRLSNVTDNFISLLYPFQWTHTYIPIMSDQMLKYLETFLPFLNGINSSLMPLVTEVFQSGDMEESEEMFLVYINKSKFKLGSTLLGKNKKKYKVIEENVPALPSNLEKELKNKLKKIKDEIESFKKKNPGNPDLSLFDLKIRNAFIEMFVLMFHDIDKYMCFLEDDVVFNKNLFLETIPNSEKRFYDEFIETQLFQLFTQNYANDELDYFKTMINEYNRYKQFVDQESNVKNIVTYVKRVYYITPDYLGIKDKNNLIIEQKIDEKYELKGEKDEDGLLLDNKRITEYIQKIDDKNYNNKNCNIYIMPEDPNSKSKESNDLSKKGDDVLKIQKTFKKKKGEMDEREKDIIKEKIKDFTVKIFKSEDIETDDAHLKKDLQTDLNTNVGREFFTNLLSKNTSNIILLKDKPFNLLGTLIYNTLLNILQIEENSQTLGQAVALIKSTRYFGKEEKEKVGYFKTGEKKSTITLWSLYKKKFRGYSKINQANLWNKWYEIDLNLEKEKDNDVTKKKVIINICEMMIELELIKSFIKNTLDKLIKKVFVKDKEKGEKILQEAIQKIILAKYVSRAKNTKK